MKTLKIKHLLLATAISLVFVNQAHAYTTYGSYDCGEWVTESKSTGPMRSWLLGFMTGLNAMYDLSGRNDDPLSKINSAKQIYVWMDNFCQKNPLKTVTSGGVDLFIELMKK